MIGNGRNTYVYNKGKHRGASGRGPDGIALQVILRQ